MTVPVVERAAAAATDLFLTAKFAGECIETASFASATAYAVAALVEARNLIAALDDIALALDEPALGRAAVRRELRSLLT